MKNLKFLLIILALVVFVFQACKQEEIDSKQFVKNYFVGKWPVNARIAITLKNGDTISNDTTLYKPVDTAGADMDTLLFTADGKYTKKDITVNYTIDATGDHISYSTSPTTTWTIKHLRSTGITLSQERAEKIGNDNFIYYKEEQLMKIAN